MPNDSYLSNGTIVEAPLTINIPTGQMCRNPSDNCYQSISQGTNITVPVFVQKQPLPNVTSAEGLDNNGASNATLPPRRKRKPWSEAEDLELIAAVQKCGEGNWANILKGDFKGDRTASQLSQVPFYQYLFFLDGFKIIEKHIFFCASLFSRIYMFLSCHLCMIFHCFYFKCPTLSQTYLITIFLHYEKRLSLQIVG